MKKRFNEEQIIRMLQEAESGAPMAADLKKIYSSPAVEEAGS